MLKVGMPSASSSSTLLLNGLNTGDHSQILENQHRTVSWRPAGKPARHHRPTISLAPSAPPRTSAPEDLGDVTTPQLVERRSTPQAQNAASTFRPRSNSISIRRTTISPASPEATIFPSYPYTQSDQSLPLTHGLQPSPIINDASGRASRPSLSLSGGPSIHSFQEGIQVVLQTLYQDFRQIKGLRFETTFSAIKATQTDTIKFIALCLMWYISSALSSSTGKEILGPFRYPVTLTFVQFGYVAGYCLLLAKGFGMTRIRTVNRSIVSSTFPMALFQIAGHVFSSMAISRVPVSTVHTIKALSPLFTVAAYSLLFQVNYTFSTYFSLLPLTLGVMLACSLDVSASSGIGFLCAFGSCLIFVSQNIFSKKLLFNGPQPAGPRGGPKLDKLNLLFYSSGLAFLLMVPLWFYADGLNLFYLWSNEKSPANGQGGRVICWLFLNGLVHFGQNILAFSVLASTSTVTYSIASLVKRIFVIVASIIYFGQSTTSIQAFGIFLTFIGLYLYNQAKADVNRGERRLRQVEAEKDLILPINKMEQMTLEGHAKLTPPVTPGGLGLTTHGNGHVPFSAHPFALANGHHPPIASRPTAPGFEAALAGTASAAFPEPDLSSALQAQPVRYRPDLLREQNNATPVTEVQNG